MTAPHPVLIDIGPLSCGCADHALEHLHKAMSEPGDDDGIWAPHESVFVRELIERITQEGGERISALQREMLAWMAGSEPGMPVGHPTKRIAQALRDLAVKPRADWAPDDYRLLVDCLVEANLQGAFPAQIAQMASKQAAIMGRVQAAMGGVVAVGAAAEVLAYLEQAARADRALELSRIHESIVDYGTAHAAENIVALADTTRHRIKQTVLENVKQSVLQGKPAAAGPALQTQLMDDFAVLNRDWRRIAITETGEMANQGFVSAMPVGQKVRRIEQYKGACPFCRKIDGAIATVVSADKPDKNWDTEIWPGKTNVGRSASPYKRTPMGLVERTRAERWALPAGLVHPHCRGIWQPVQWEPQEDEFTQWLGREFALTPKKGA